MLKNLMISLASLAAALGVGASVRADTVVSVDYGYALAKESCREVWLRYNPSRADACAMWQGEFNDFSSRLDAQFASDPLCHGITFVSGYSDSAREKLKGPHWFFWVEYTTGEETQSWWIGSPDWQSTFKGSGGPREIAQTVCSVLTGRGGVISR
jgi:hypothetical protein